MDCQFYALSHAQDYISTPCNAHLQVVFYDNAYNALAVYGSVFLDPNDLSRIPVDLGGYSSSGAGCQAGFICK